MDIENMTPEQIREYAAAREQAREDLTARYMGREKMEVVPGRGADGDGRFIRHVDFEGVSYPVDMRRVKCRKTMKGLVRLQSQDAPGGSDMIDLMDYIFEGECEDRIVETVNLSKGFDDYEEILRIESGIIEALDLKN